MNLNRPKFLLLDRDGVLNVDRVDYVKTKEELIIPSTSIKAVKILKAFGYRLLVFTNQSCIAKGIMTEEQVAYIHNLINEAYDYAIDMFYYCPHYFSSDPDSSKTFGTTVRDDLMFECDCRKPKPGLLVKAQSDFMREGLDLNETWFIGDSYRDIEAGLSVGCRVGFLRSTPRTITKFYDNYDRLMDISRRQEKHGAIRLFDNLLHFVLEVIVT